MGNLSRRSSLLRIGDWLSLLTRITHHLCGPRKIWKNGRIAPELWVLTDRRRSGSRAAPCPSGQSVAPRHESQPGSAGLQPPAPTPAGPTRTLARHGAALDTHATPKRRGPGHGDSTGSFDDSRKHTNTSSDRVRRELTTSGRLGGISLSPGALRATFLGGDYSTSDVTGAGGAVEVVDSVAIGLDLGVVTSGPGPDVITTSLRRSTVDAQVSLRTHSPMAARLRYSR